MKDMTSGSPMRLIIAFLIPTWFGMLFQQLYSLVDTMLVGKFLGSAALAAVGASGAVNFMIIGFCIGIASGFAIPIAQRFGAADEVNLRRFVANSIWLCVIIAVLLTLATTILTPNIMHWMLTPDEIYKDACLYIFIIFCGLPCTILYNMASGIIRALGDSRTPLYFLILSSGLNIALDLILIVVIPLGVAGAAIATVVSQGISGIGCVIFMKKSFPILHMKREEMAWNMDCVKQLTIIGIPMGLQYSVTAIGSMILQAAVNSLGTLYVAATAAGNKICFFIQCLTDSLGTTLATYVGQNVGAKRLDRVDQGLKSAVLVGWVYSAVAFVLCMFFANYLCLLFVKKEEVELIALTATYIKISAAFLVFLTLVNTVRFAIQAMGYSVFAITAGIFEMVARGGVGIFITPIFGYVGTCFGSPMAWVLADIFLIPAYLYCRKRVARNLGIEG